MTVINFYLAFGLLLVASLGKTMPCSVLRVESQSNGGLISSGNAIAISKTRLILNEHVIAENTERITVKLNADRKVSAKVIHSDFHTDLAVIELEQNASLIACELSAEQPSINSMDYQIVGFADQNTSPHQIAAKITNAESKSHEIPGLDKTIELNGLNQTVLGIRKSLSGSALFHGSKVIGIISQVRNDGYVMAIPASAMNLYISNVAAGNLKNRRYSYSRSQNRFYFDGLVLSSQNKPQRIAGNPHEGAPVIVAGKPHEGRWSPRGGGTTHEGAVFPQDSDQIYSQQSRTKMVNSNEDQNVGVLAEVSDTQELARLQPQIHRFIKASEAKKIIIKSIDGQDIKSLYSLVQTLGRCSPCKIDNFAVVVEQAAKISSYYMRGTRLLWELEKSFEAQSHFNLTPDTKAAVSEVGRLFISLESDIDGGLGISGTDQQKLKTNWDVFERGIANAFLIDRQLDLLLELRQIVSQIPKSRQIQ